MPEAKRNADKNYADVSNVIHQSQVTVAWCWQFRIRLFVVVILVIGVECAAISVKPAEGGYDSNGGRIGAIKPEIAAIVLSDLFEGNTCWQVVTKRVAGSGPSSLLV
ncbi:MAG: hypothetical protein ACR2G6_13455 [Gemmatimonadaceae bacterium]